MSIPSSPELDRWTAAIAEKYGLTVLPIREAQHAVSTQPLLAEIERLKGEVAEWERTADGTVLDAVRLSRVAVAEAQKLREALDRIRRLLPLHRALTENESIIEQTCDALLGGSK